MRPPEVWPDAHEAAARLRIAPLVARLGNVGADVGVVDMIRVAGRAAVRKIAQIAQIDHTHPVEPRHSVSRLPQPWMAVHPLRQCNQAVAPGDMDGDAAHHRADGRQLAHKHVEIDAGRQQDDLPEPDIPAPRRDVADRHQQSPRTLAAAHLGSPPGRAASAGMVSARSKTLQDRSASSWVSVCKPPSEGQPNHGNRPACAAFSFGTVARRRPFSTSMKTPWA
nr:hypothetical protein [Rhodobaculum claviforme]